MIDQMDDALRAATIMGADVPKSGPGSKTAGTPLPDISGKILFR